jgi:hypothetical protein
MGQGTVGVDPQQLETEIAELRDELGALVAELDARRHELFDVRLQLRRHAGRLVLTGLALSAVVGGVVWLGVRRARRRQNVVSRAGRLREGIARVVERPERLAVEPTLGSKLLAVAASAAIGTAARKAVEGLVRRAAEWDAAASSGTEAGNGRHRRAA